MVSFCFICHTSWLPSLYKKETKISIMPLTIKKDSNFLWLKSWSYLWLYFKATYHYFICCKILFAFKVLQKCCKNNLTIWVMSANPHKHWVFRHLITRSDHSHSTKPNQFCLEIILCRIHGAFDYLIYPYYPAYMG